MKRICRELQERLALEGAQALREDEAAQRHLEGCDACFQVLENLARFDETLAAMSSVDAPEAVVSALMERVAAEPAAASASDAKSTEESPRGIVVAFRRWTTTRQPMFWSLTSAASVAVVAVALAMKLWLRSELPSPSPSREPAFMKILPGAGTKTGGDVTVTMNGPVSEEDQAGARRQRKLDAPDKDGDRVVAFVNTGKESEQRGATGLYTLSDATTTATSPADAPATVSVTASHARSAAIGYSTHDSELERLDAEKKAELAAREAQALKQVPKVADERTYGATVDTRVGDGTTTTDDAFAREKSNRQDSFAGEKERDPLEGYRQETMTRNVDVPAVRVGGTIQQPKLLKRVEPTYPPAAASARLQGTVILDIQVDPTGKVSQAKALRGNSILIPAAIEAVKQWVYAPTRVNGTAVSVSLTVTVTFRPGDGKPGSSVTTPQGPARAFLEERAALQNVAFQDPAGYWSNTYVPGDARMRLFQSRLVAWDRSAMATPPHDAAAPPMQPFDAPRNAALAVYVNADRAAIEGPQRMLVQVGLKGSARVGGARPAMNVAVVLDLRGEPGADVAASMRALAVAFAQARQTGDRFRLIVAGRPGGVVVAPDAFKYGPVTVAFDRLFAGTASGDTLDLSSAVAAAFQAVCNGNDPDAPFGSGAVVLVTGQSFGATTGALADFAHQGAVAGIPLTAVGVGPDVAAAELDTLALAGQGRRRVFDAHTEAARLVDEELYAASNTVARAVRLRIRLAPGVKLVDVIGSRRLDDAQAERVREAERSLDLRLAQHLGIESDRGKDEDGIQVVIPAFQAGDGHAILLDVVAPGPGAVVDVSVRYKDVAFLRNGVARASLTLPAGQRAAGPLERNVLKNLLALRLSLALQGAGDAVAAGDLAGAGAAIEDARALLVSLQGQLPGLGGDADLARDITMLGGYARLLGNSALAPAQRALVADSLHYAGRLKLLRRHA